MKEDSSTSDQRAAKLDKLDQTYKMVRSGASHPVQGFAMVRWRCEECTAINLGTKAVSYENDVFCPTCDKNTTHTRVRDGQE